MTFCNSHKKYFPVCVSVLFCYLLFMQPVVGQEPSVHIGPEYDGLNMSQFIEQVESNKAVRIFYYDTEIGRTTVLVGENGGKLKRILEKNFSDDHYRVSKDESGNYFILKKQTIFSSLPDKIFEVRQTDIFGAPEVADSGKTPGESLIKTYSDYITREVVIGSQNSRESIYDRPLIQGYVTASEDQEPIPQVTLKVEELNKYKTCNRSGYYSFLLDPGEYTLTVSSMGRYGKKYKLTVLGSGRLNISLEPKPFMIGEAVVSTERHHNVRTGQMGFEKLESQQIKAMPVVMGEQDIVQAALMLPGIQSVSEVSSGFNVRGSPADQNMFYIDGLPVYNVSHLFGLFTAFNPDAIDEFSVYKANIPIHYGGRLSSVFDIRTQAGNLQEFKARGGISPVTSRMVAEGPIWKDKSSYLVGVRSTYSDWVLENIKDPQVRNSSARFMDGLARLDINFGKNDKIRIFGYASKDQSDLEIGAESLYNNLGMSLKWSHFFHQHHRMELSFIQSNYNFTKENSSIAYLANEQSFDLDHGEAKLRFEYEANEKHHIQYGLNSVLYRVSRGDFLPLHEASRVKPISFEPEKGMRHSFFVNEEWEIFPDFTLNGGIRGTLYNYLGPQTVFSYGERQARERINITDTTHYGQDESIQSYKNMNYRLSAKYQPGDDLSFKVSYNRLHQYIFMLSNTISVTPTNYWKLAGPHIQPMEGKQYSAGVYKNFLGDRVESSIELYYKSVDHQVDFKDGALFSTNELPETDIIQGDLKAWGMELMLRKKTGRLTGWLNYTLSKARIRAINPVTGEQNNQGYAYPANYEKPHAFNMTLNYKLTKRFTFSANLVYSTGRPVTYPDKIYYLDGIQITGFSRRNQYRLPDYFRTDLSIHIEGNLKKDKLAHGSWNISLYNITGRKNPYSVYFKNDGGKIQAYKLSIFGTLIPSITYNLKLGNYAD